MSQKPDFKLKGVEQWWVKRVTEITDQQERMIRANFELQPPGQYYQFCTVDEGLMQGGRVVLLTTN